MIVTSPLRVWGDRHTETTGPMGRLAWEPGLGSYGYPGRQPVIAEKSRVPAAQPSTRGHGQVERAPMCAPRPVRPSWAVSLYLRKTEIQMSDVMVSGP